MADTISEMTLNDLDSILIEIVDKGKGIHWRDKKEQIEAQLSDNGKLCLQEFVSWFEDEE